MKYIVLFFLCFSYLFSNSIEFTKEETTWIKNNKVIIGIESAKPYIYFDEEKKDIDGLYADILKLIVKKSSLNIEYKKDEWSELLTSFKNKEIDILPATFYSKEREKFGLYSKPYYQVREYIYTKNKSSIESFEDLSNKKVAIVKGYATIKKLKEKYPNINIVETKNLAQSISLLENEKVEALVDYHLVVETYIKDNSIVGLKSISQSNLDAIFVHYLSNINKPILHSIIQKSLDSISKEELDELLKYWVRNPFSQELLTSSEKYFLENNTFNIYLNDWKPFSIHNKEDNSFKGLSIEIWEEIAKKANIKYNYIYEKNFSQMLKNVKNDSHGLIISTSETNDRKIYASFTKMYNSFPVAIATKIEENYIIDFKELEGKKVAVGKNFTAHKLLKKHYKNIDFVTVSSTDEALLLLEKGEVFAAADILPVLVNNISKYHHSTFKINGEKDLGFDLKIMVNKQSSKLIKILNKTIDVLDESTFISQTNDKWIKRVRYIKSVDYGLLYKIFVPLLIILVILLVLYSNQKKSNKIINKQRKELKNLNERFQLTLDAVEDGIWDWNIDTNHLYFSKNWAKMLGYNPDELKNCMNTFFNLIHEDDRNNLKEILNSHFENPLENRYSVRVRLKCKDGSYKWILTRGKVILDENKKPYRMLGYHSDITAEIKNEEYIKNQDKVISEQSRLASMGEMIGNIAHQWRQPLNVISTSATGLKLHKDYGSLDDAKIDEMCENINKNAQYLSQTIDDFRNFIKGDREKNRI